MRIKAKILIFTILLIFSKNAFALELSDIEGHKYYEAIEFVKSREIVHGYPDATFLPDKNLNRAELLKVALESNYSETEINEYSGKECFEDVDSALWFSKYVCLALDKDIIKGYPDGTFRPIQEVSFVESLKIIQVAYGIPFIESPLPHWFEHNLKEAISMNIIPLDIAWFEQKITRGQMAEMLTRLIKYNEKNLDEYLGTKKYFSVTYKKLEEGAASDWEWTQCEKGFFTFCPLDYILETEAFSDSLASVNKNLNTCETLIQNGAPEDKIDIVFIAEGGISFDLFKAFIEGFFLESENLLNFFDQAFASYFKQFNFYSIWKEEDYACLEGTSDCYNRIMQLASLCPIESAYDGITLLFPSSEEFSNASWGQDKPECLRKDAYSGTTVTLSTGESFEINECPGSARIHRTTPAQYNNIGHEWEHMIADLSHEEMKLSEAEQRELICEKISEGSDISLEECIGENN